MKNNDESGRSEVSKIVDHRYISGILEYRVHWKGTSEDGSEDEWFSAKSLNSKRFGVSLEEQKINT